MCQVNKLHLKLKKCDEQKIFVTLIWKGQRVELCEKCWNKIADTDLEWGDDGK